MTSSRSGNDGSGGYGTSGTGSGRYSGRHSDDNSDGCGCSGRVPG